MTTVKDISNYINSFAPNDSMEEWDNCGILIGNENQVVKTCVLALDATKAVVDYAISVNAQLIITHHPVVFSGLRQVLSGTVIHTLVEKKISVISTHTPYDKSDSGINYALAKFLGLNNLKKADNDFLVIGELDAVMSVDDFAQFVSDTLLVSGLRYTDTQKEIKTVAVCGGSGDDFMRDAKESADCYITGEARYHALLEAAEDDFAVICAGHFETENFAFLEIEKKLKDTFANVAFEIAEQKNPVLAV